MHISISVYFKNREGRLQICHKGIRYHHIGITNFRPRALLAVVRARMGEDRLECLRKAKLRACQSEGGEILPAGNADTFALCRQFEEENGRTINNLRDDRRAMRSCMMSG